MKKLILLFLLTSQIFACYLCQLQVPKVDVYINGSYEKEKLNFSVKWMFDKSFSNETKLAYDTNINNKLEKSEIKAIQKALEDYLDKNSFLTLINYGKINSPLDLKIIYITDTKLYYDKTTMVYEYNFYVPINLLPNYNLKIDVSDVNNFFAFHIKKLDLDGYKEYYKKSFNLSNGYIFTHKDDVDLQNLKIISQLDNNQTIQKQPVKDIVQTTTPNQNDTNNQTKEPEQSFLQKLFSDLKQKIQDLLEDIKNNNSLTSYFLLLFFSFIYGVVHAVGPGHGKSLVGAYFLSQNRSYLKAFNLSALIGIIHTFSAAIITFVIYYVINTYLSKVYPDIEKATIKASAIIIILIAIYLIYKKYKSLKVKYTFSPIKQNFTLLKQNPIIHQSSCGCNSCKNSNSTDIGVVIAAGIVPCPGTITIFVFTMSLGLYFIGFISAVMMSLGMSIVIFLVSVFSLKIQNKMKKNSLWIKVLEYGSLVFIFTLGMGLLFI